MHVLEIFKKSGSSNIWHYTCKSSNIDTTFSSLCLMGFSTWNVWWKRYIIQGLIWQYSKVSHLISWRWGRTVTASRENIAVDLCKFTNELSEAVNNRLRSTPHCGDRDVLYISTVTKLYGVCAMHQPTVQFYYSYQTESSFQLIHNGKW